MSEEINVNNIENLASQYGWNPEGEKTAEEFVKVALEKFPDQSKKIKQLFKTVDDLKVHLDKTEKFAYERAKKELDDQRKAAILEGDVETVERLDKEREQLQIVETSPEMHPSILEFEERNSSWLNGTSYEEIEMQQWVVQHGQMLGQKLKLPTNEHMALLEQHLKKKFPQYFEVQEETQIKTPVMSSNSNVASSKKGKKNYTLADLTIEQQNIAKNFSSLGVMTVEDYIKDLVKHGEI